MICNYKHVTHVSRWWVLGHNSNRQRLVEDWIHRIDGKRKLKNHSMTNHCDLQSVDIRNSGFRWSGCHQLEIFHLLSDCCSTEFSGVFRISKKGGDNFRWQCSHKGGKPCFLCLLWWKIVCWLKGAMAQCPHRYVTVWIYDSHGNRPP